VSVLWFIKQQEKRENFFTYYKVPYIYISVGSCPQEIWYTLLKFIFFVFWDITLHILSKITFQGRFSGSTSDSNRGVHYISKYSWQDLYYFLEPRNTQDVIVQSFSFKVKYCINLKSVYTFFIYSVNFSRDS